MEQVVVGQLPVAVFGQGQGDVTKLSLGDDDGPVATYIENNENKP